MPIMAKSNDEYTEVKAIKTPDGTEIDYVLSKVDNTYKRTYTATRELEDTPPLEFKSIKPQANLLDYRIYGQTSRNLFTTENKLENYYIESNGLILSTPNYNTTDFLQVDPNTAYSYSFINSYIEGDRLCPIAFYNKNKEFISCNLHRGEYPIGRVTVPFTTTSNTFYVRISYLTIIVDENMMLSSGSTPLPYEPYGESVGDRTGNLFDKSQFIQSNLVLRANSTYTVEDPYTISTILPCKPNTKYTITKIITNRFFIWGCENYPVDGGNGNGDIVRDDNATSLTFTTGSNDNFLLVMLFYRRQPNDPTVEDVKNNLMYNYGEMCPYEPYGYKVPVTVSNGTDTLTTPIYLPEQIKKVGDEAEYIDYAEQKQHRVRKNLVTSCLVEPNGGTQFYPVVYAEVNLQPNTEYLITYTVHENGVKLCSNDLLFTSAYYSSEIQGKQTMRLKTKTDMRPDQYKNNKGWVLLRNAKQNPSDFTITEVQIQLASIEDDTYEPYIENTDLDVTLPALPTVTGTNVLSVGTEVQPSDMYIKGNFKMIAGGGE